MYPDNSNKSFFQVSGYVSKYTKDQLNRIAADRNTTLSKLVAIAIDNELDTPSPFAYPCEIPTSGFLKDAYSAEAQKISMYLKRFPNGADFETIMLHRHDHGVADKNTVMLAIRELLNIPEIFEMRDPVDKYGKKLVGRLQYLGFRREIDVNHKAKYADRLERDIKRKTEQLERMRKS